jgi:hypothetical protein
VEYVAHWVHGPCPRDEKYTLKVRGGFVAQGWLRWRHGQNVKVLLYNCKLWNWLCHDRMRSDQPLSLDTWTYVTFPYTSYCVPPSGWMWILWWKVAQSIMKVNFMMESGTGHVECEFCVGKWYRACCTLPQTMIVAACLMFWHLILASGVPSQLLVLLLYYFNSLTCTVYHITCMTSTQQATHSA